MNPILILGGFVVLYVLLEKQMSSLTGNISGGTSVPPVVRTSISANAPNASIGPSGLQWAQAGTQAGLQVGQDVASSLAEAGNAAAGVVGSAIPIVGSLLQPIFGMLAAHTARVKGATTENQALNSVFPAMQADIQSVFQAYGAGQVNQAQAETALQIILENYWNAVAPFEHGPGQAGGPNSCVQVNPPELVGADGYGVTTRTPYSITAAGTMAYFKSPCNSTCTVSCCAGCNSAQNWIAAAITAIRNNKRATIKFRGQVGSHYGWTGVQAWSYNFVPQ